MLTMIWCQDIKGGIGIDNTLPWNIKDEMDHFKTTTANSVVVMGEATYKSIGKNLPNRENVILSLDPEFTAEDVKVYHSIDSYIYDYGHRDSFVIGGKSIYEQFLCHADELIISSLRKDYHCNKVLNFSLEDFALIKTERHDEFDVNFYKRIAERKI